MSTRTYAIIICIARPDYKRPRMDVEYLKADSMSKAMKLVKNSFQELIQNYQECTDFSFESYEDMTEFIYMDSYMDNPVFDYKIFNGTDWITPKRVSRLFKSIISKSKED